MPDQPEVKSPARLVEILLDEASIARSTPDVEHERAVAIYDLIEDNVFAPVGYDGGPYRLKIALAENRLSLEITDISAGTNLTHILSMTSFRRIVKDYFLICDSYYSAIRTASPSHIEAIDMGRRGLHNEGSQFLLDRLADKVTIDFGTARRLFTLLSALHWKG